LRPAARLSNSREKWAPRLVRPGEQALEPGRLELVEAAAAAVAGARPPELGGETLGDDLGSSKRPRVRLSQSS
jgi:hypothetical protein